MLIRDLAAKPTITMAKTPAKRGWKLLLPWSLHPYPTATSPVLAAPTALEPGSLVAMLCVAALCRSFSFHRGERGAEPTAIETYADHTIKFLCEFKKLRVDFMTQIGRKMLVSTLIVTEIKWLNSH